MINSGDIDTYIEAEEKCIIWFIETPKETSLDNRNTCYYYQYNPAIDYNKAKSKPF